LVIEDDAIVIEEEENTAVNDQMSKLIGGAKKNEKDTKAKYS